MRDVLLAVVVIVLLIWTIRQPWIGVLTWTWIGLMNPHRLAFGFSAHGSTLGRRGGGQRQAAIAGCRGLCRGDVARRGNRRHGRHRRSRQRGWGCRHHAPGGLGGRPGSRPGTALAVDSR